MVLQCLYRGIVSKDIITHISSFHGCAHGRSGLSNRVTAKVDTVGWVFAHGFPYTSDIKQFQVTEKGKNEGARTSIVVLL